MKRITLTQNQVALVDDEDYEFLNQFKGYASKTKVGTWYVKRGSNIYMHQVLYPNIIKPLEIDHIDTDGLNNQRHNLRITTHLNNCKNTSLRKHSSKYKGVRAYRNKNNIMYRVTIKSNNKYLHLGSFKTEREAALVYNKKATELFGEFANLNIII